MFRLGNTQVSMIHTKSYVLSLCSVHLIIFYQKGDQINILIVLRKYIADGAVKKFQ